MDSRRCKIRATQRACRARTNDAEKGREGIADDEPEPKRKCLAAWMSPDDVDERMVEVNTQAIMSDPPFIIARIDGDTWHGHLMPYLGMRDIFNLHATGNHHMRARLDHPNGRIVTKPWTTLDRFSSASLDQLPKCLASVNVEWRTNKLIGNVSKNRHITSLRFVAAHETWRNDPKWHLAKPISSGLLSHVKQLLLTMNRPCVAIFSQDPLVDMPFPSLESFQLDDRRIGMFGDSIGDALPLPVWLIEKALRAPNLTSISLALRSASNVNLPFTNASRLVNIELNFRSSMNEQLSAPIEAFPDTCEVLSLTFCYNDRSFLPAALPPHLNSLKLDCLDLGGDDTLPSTRSELLPLIQCPQSITHLSVAVKIAHWFDRLYHSADSCHIAHQGGVYQKGIASLTNLTHCSLSSKSIYLEQWTRNLPPSCTRLHLSGTITSLPGSDSSSNPAIGCKVVHLTIKTWAILSAKSYFKQLDHLCLHLDVCPDAMLLRLLIESMQDCDTHITIKVGSQMAGSRLLSELSNIRHTKRGWVTIQLALSTRIRYFNGDRIEPKPGFEYKR